MTSGLPDYRLLPLPGEGPEDVVFDQSGRVYTGLIDGRVLRVEPGTGKVEVMVSTGGRPLGLEVRPDGRLLICDSPRGLLQFDPPTSELTTLVAEDGGSKLIFCSNVVAASNGDIFFTVSSMRHDIHGWRRDLVENIPTGRLYRLSAAGELEKLMDGLLFANGLTLAPDGSHIIVAETGRLRLQRHWLTGPKAGASEIFCELPGFPDNMSMDGDGLNWVTIASERNDALAAIHKLPYLLRWLIARLPPALQPRPARVAWVMAFNAQGQVVHDLKWVDGKYSIVTGVCKQGPQVVCGSLMESSLLLFRLE